MRKPTWFVVAFGLVVISILLFMAGQPRFDFLPQRQANFLGTAAVLISGLFWIMWAVTGRRKRE